ncbi:hypothetical protein C1A38_05350 [Verrucosispora sp. ts21]|uniref:hypothetical protein n=1 Tax=Verrucosispora sp. ts21 TaxID=2069341 RepID=UPI000C87F936|nr:hypothetical protein [Verrucosispora sp. ts21]PMR62160.1 hypothetical protein C1A38_05350 [Verrucosispora sp. ts21]
MSQHDLGLKVAARRLLWRMGYTTRLNVELRGVWALEQERTQDRGRRTSQPESFTDLDVLGIGIIGSRVHSAIVDCKTTKDGSTGRMFWIRGVTEFFAADDAYMVRDSNVTDAARQLASRLGITALTKDDLSRLEALHPSDLPLGNGPVSWLFDSDRAVGASAAFVGLDKRLKPLLDYRNFNYWLYDEYRNPVQLVEQLRSCAELLDPRSPHHLALVLDLAWLYLITVSHGIHAIRAAHMANPDRGLAQYLHGGAVGLREKQDLAQMLVGLRDAGALPAKVDLDPLPSYYPKMLELVTRIMRRPDRVLPALRLLEVVTSAMALKERVEPKDLGGLFDELAAKQAADVVGFLVTTTGLDLGFRARARSLLLGEPVV